MEWDDGPERTRSVLETAISLFAKKVPKAPKRSTADRREAERKEGEMKVNAFLGLGRILASDLDAFNKLGIESNLEKDLFSRKLSVSLFRTFFPKKDGGYWDKGKDIRAKPWEYDHDLYNYFSQISDVDADVYQANTPSERSLRRGIGYAAREVMDCVAEIIVSNKNQGENFSRKAFEIFSLLRKRPNENPFLYIPLEIDVKGLNSVFERYKKELQKFRS